MVFDNNIFLLQSATACYYKVRELLFYKVRQVYYKVQQVLQNTTIITKCDSTFVLGSLSCLLFIVVFPSKITYVAMQGKNESINETYFDVSGVSSLSISYSVDNQTFKEYVYNGEKYVSFNHC